MRRTAAERAADALMDLNNRTATELGEVMNERDPEWARHVAAKLYRPSGAAPKVEVDRGE